MVGILPALASSSCPMTIVIVEDHVLTRDLLRVLCEGELGHQVVGEAGRGPEAVETILRCKPDLVLLDLHLPEMGGLSVVEAIRRAGCHPRILALSSFCDEYTFHCIERIGLNGFVDKMKSLVEHLKEAIGTIASGRTYFSETYQSIGQAHRSNPQAFDKILTASEQRIMTMIGDMLTDREIAQRLEIRDLTVEKHRSNILRKLGVRHRIGLALYARQHGLTQALGLDASGT